MRGTSALSFGTWPAVAVGAGADVAVDVGVAVKAGVAVSVGNGVKVGVGVSDGVEVTVGGSGVKVGDDVSDVGVAVGATDTDDESPHATRSNITTPQKKFAAIILEGSISIQTILKKWGDIIIHPSMKLR